MAVYRLRNAYGEMSKLDKGQDYILATSMSLNCILVAVDGGLPSTAEYESVCAAIASYNSAVPQCAAASSSNRLRCKN